MHPYVDEGLARERLRQLYEEAARERFLRSLAASEPRNRVRVVLGERMVRLGMRLAGSEHGRAMTVRFHEE